MSGAFASAQKMVWDLRKADGVKESHIAKIIKPKNSKVHRYIMINSKIKMFHNIFIKLTFIHIVSHDEK